MTWIISLLTIISVWLAGKKNKHSWSLAIVCQAVWMLYIVKTAEYGLIPFTVAMTTISVRNYILWDQEGRQSARN